MKTKRLLKHGSQCADYYRLNRIYLSLKLQLILTWLIVIYLIKTFDMMLWDFDLELVEYYVIVLIKTEHYKIY